MRRDAFALTACFVLCAAAIAVRGGEQMVTRKDLGIQISFPESWHVNGSRSGDGNDVLVYAPEGGSSFGAYALIRVTALNEGDSLRSFFTISKELKGKTLAALDLVRLDGVAAIKLDVDAKTIIDERRWIVHYAIAGGRGYAIWLGGTKADVDKHVKDFDAIVASFKIIDPK